MWTLILETFQHRTVTPHEIKILLPKNCCGCTCGYETFCNLFPASGSGHRQRRRNPLEMMEKWTIVCFLLVQFISSSMAVGCETPPVVENAYHSIRGLEGTTQVTYRCVKGRLFGAKVLSCNATRQWDAAPPVCKEECGTPEKIPNAQLQFPHYKLETFAVDYKVQYECVPGFTKESGETAAVCRPDFTWDIATLICKRNEQSCPNLDLPNVEITSGLKTSYVRGDTITIQCSPGFLLEGSQTFICKSEGTWHPELPKCVKTQFTHCGIKLEDWKPALENEKRCLEELKADLERGNLHQSHSLS